jgi:hypothetical protein
MVVCTKVRRTGVAVKNGDAIPLIRKHVVPHTTTARTELGMLEHWHDAELRRTEKYNQDAKECVYTDA